MHKLTVKIYYQHAIMYFSPSINFRSIKRTKISNFKLWNETDLRLHLEDTNLTNSVSIRNIVVSKNRKRK